MRAEPFPIPVTYQRGSGTWDEMAHYDLPAMIEKVLELTGESELFYAGHSMGTTALMAMHHYRPDIGEK